MKFKKSALLISLFCILSLFTGCARADNPGFYLYKSSPLGFQIEYPDSWAKQVDNSSKIVAFLTPTEGFGDEYRDNVTISVEDAGENSFDEYYQNYYASLPATFAGFTEEQSKDVLIGNKEARQITFTSSTTQKDDDGNEKKISLKITQYVVNCESRIYFITYIAAPGSFDYFEPFFNTMLETVHFNE